MTNHSTTSGPKHSHEAHDHAISADADRRYLWMALILLGIFMVAEVIVSFVTGSLALLSDAGHMLSDVGAIGLALWTIHLVARPAQGALTWGLKRVEIISAAVNGITLLVVAGVIAVEAIRRLFEPPEVDGGPVLIVAVVGVAVNIVVAWLVARANRSSLNVEGAYQHILTDLYGFIGTIVAALIIMATGWTLADVIASLLVCALMVHAAWKLLHAAGRVLLEAAPEGIDLEEITDHILELPHVRRVHDLHVWSVSTDLPALSAHIVVDEECFTDGHIPQLLDQMQDCVAGSFDVEHSTFQFEPPTHGAREFATHPCPGIDP